MTVDQRSVEIEDWRPTCVKCWGAVPNYGLLFCNSCVYKLEPPDVPAMQAELKKLRAEMPSPADGQATSKRGK